MHADELQQLTASLTELAAQLGDLTQSKPGPLFLALDQGGHASRALVFDQQGRQVAQAFAAIGTQRIGTDRVEHDAQEIVQSLHTVIEDVAHSLGPDTELVQAAGLATQRSSIVCWDARDGHALSPVLSWQDRRHAALVE
jgi:glycerol kinase